MSHRISGCGGIPEVMQGTRPLPPRADMAPANLKYSCRHVSNLAAGATGREVEDGQV
jgi:hypothetical protein